MILLLAVLGACAGGFRSTRVLGEQEYVAFADRPSGGYAPMEPPDCAGGDEACHGQWLAPVHIGPRGGTIERVLQTPDKLVVYVRAADCTYEAPNWTLLLRKPQVELQVVQLTKVSDCSTPTAQQ